MKFFKKNKKIIYTLIPVLLLGIFILFPDVVSASVGTVVATVLGWILYPIIWLMGKLVILLIGILIGVAQYNEFINSNAVSFGWALVRDLCNMFFILILLVIAFATILRIESYNLKTWLPKLLIMAVLINFSKLICGVFIDFTQVIMLTFVNAFKDLAGANLTEMLGISKILSFESSGTDDVTGWSILGSVILALIFSVISVIVILSMLVMLAMRIIMIWIYVVLSPLAYLLASFPQGQSYSQRWWSEFSKNLIIGPVLAFFIWLSFASLGGVEGSNDIQKMKNTTYDDQGNELVGMEGSAGLTEAGSYDHMLKFIISIGMLLGGMMIAQEMGGVAGKALGKVSGKLNAAVTKGAKRIGTNTAKRAGETTLRATGGLGNLMSRSGRGNQLTRLAGAWGNDMRATRVKKSEKSRQKLMENMGMGERAGIAGQEITGSIRSFLNNPSGSGRRDVAEGNRMIEAGQRLAAGGQTMVVDGNINIEMGERLSAAQTSYSDLDQTVNDMGREGRRNDPAAYQQAVINRDNALNELNTVKQEAGLSVNSTPQETYDRAQFLVEEGTSLVDQGREEVNRGNTSTAEGQRMVNAGQRSQNSGFGNFAVGRTHGAFRRMSEDYNRAQTFTAGIAGLRAPDINRLNASRFSEANGDIDSPQRHVWDSLSQNDAAINNIVQALRQTLFDDNNQPRNDISNANLDRVEAIARGLNTYSASQGGGTPGQFTDLENVLNDFADRGGSNLGRVNSYRVGSYRITGAEKESKGMDINQSGIGSINEFGRNRGKSDTISYNFDKLKAQGIDIDTKAEGVYLEGEVKEKVKVQIIADIDKELEELKSKASSGVDLSAKDTRRVNILESSKSRLEKGDNFSLVNANKKMGLTEAVVTQRHEGAHKEIDEYRKSNNINASSADKKQEESLVEFYGQKARENSVSDKSVDSKVARVIADGQKNKLSENEIKVKIEGAVRGEKVSNIIQKESALVQNIENVTNINQTTSGNKGQNIEVNVDMSGIDKKIENISDDISKTKVAINQNKKIISDMKNEASIQSRISAYRKSK
ncbi:MAG: hypothetical protein WC280_00345 [Patescibacteria group bacterium]